MAARAAGVAGNAQIRGSVGKHNERNSCDSLVLGVRCAAFSLVTNLAAGMTEALPSHQEVMAEGERAAGYFGGMLRRLVAHPDLLTPRRGNVAA